MKDEKILAGHWFDPVLGAGDGVGAGDIMGGLAGAGWPTKRDGMPCVWPGSTNCFTP